MYLLERVASEEQKARFLAPLVAGVARSAFLMTEPDGGAGSDPSMLQTIARSEGEEWVVSGRKTFSTGADGAAFAIVMARTDSAATMFLVDMRSPGLRIERILDTIDSSMPGGHAVITLEDVRVPAQQVLGAPNEGFRYAQVRLAPARLTHCMRWWGAARRSHDVAADYACRRRAFGKPIIEHEGVGFMLADNLIDLKQAELMIDWCAGVLDEERSGTTESSMTKVAVSEALFRVADRCVQVLGGIGVTSDTIVQQVFREIRAFRIYDGPSEVHRWSLAKKIQRDLQR
jgi:acyl-CoA dehydrogenase